MTSHSLAAETRRKIVAVAAECFSSKGYSETTTRELSEAVGLQKASLYHHYASKEAILFEICSTALEDIYNAVATAQELAASASRSPSGVLTAMIEAHMDSALGHRSQHATMLIELRHLTGDNLEEVLAARSRYEQLFDKQISVAQEQGALRRDMSDRLLTLGLLNLLNWTIFWYSEDGPASPTDLAREFGNIFLEGVVPRDPGPTRSSASTRILSHD